MIYSLRIDTEKKHEKLLPNLNISPLRLEINDWGTEVFADQSISKNPISSLLELYENNVSFFKKIGLTPESFSLWVLYPYCGQCNLEFESSLLKRLGEINIDLCISCWEDCG